jgi:hypothetical protein
VIKVLLGCCAEPGHSPICRRTFSTPCTKHIICSSHVSNSALNDILFETIIPISKRGLAGRLLYEIKCSLEIKNNEVLSR